MLRTHVRHGRRAAGLASACFDPGAGPSGQRRPSGAHRAAPASRRQLRAPVGRGRIAPRCAAPFAPPGGGREDSRDQRDEGRRRGNRSVDRGDLRAIRPQLLGDNRPRDTPTLVADALRPLQRWLAEAGVLCSAIRSAICSGSRLATTARCHPSDSVRPMRCLEPAGALSGEVSSAAGTPSFARSLTPTDVGKLGSPGLALTSEPAPHVKPFPVQLERFSPLGPWIPISRKATRLGIILFG